MAKFKSLVDDGNDDVFSFERRVERFSSMHFINVRHKACFFHGGFCVPRKGHLYHFGKLSESLELVDGHFHQKKVVGDGARCAS